MLLPDLSLMCLYCLSDADHNPPGRCSLFSTPHPDSLASVLIIKSTTSLFMKLIEQGMVFNHQFNSSIAFLVCFFLQSYLFLFL